MDIASILSAVSHVLWPLLILFIVVALRHEFRALLGRAGEFGVELMGAKLRIKPTKPPTDGSQLPRVESLVVLPPDYVYVNHTSFIRPTKQQEFQRRTGLTNVTHYDINVVVDSYYEGALDNIERVEYVLHSEYDEPIRVRTNRDDRFLLKEVANGEYVLLAKVLFKGRDKPIMLTRYITLWKDGPRLSSESLPARA